jgi:hypothetical protein
LFNCWQHGQMRENKKQGPHDTQFRAVRGQCNRKNSCWIAIIGILLKWDK